jgi:hypothetical protein
MISEKMIFFFFFFSMFGCIPKNVPKNILQCCAKDRAKGAGVRRAFLENGLQKNWG